MGALSLNRKKIRQVTASVDWGFTNPGVILVWAIDNDGRMFLIREIYRTRKTIDWWIDRAKDCKDDYGVSVFVCDPAEPGFIKQFNDAGLNAVAGMNSIVPGIDAVQRRLRPAEDGLPRLFIARDVQIERDPDLAKAGKPDSVSKEFGSYVWEGGKRVGPAKEKPVDDSNHGLDAVRYMVAHFDLKKQISTTAPTSIPQQSKWKGRG